MKTDYSDLEAMESIAWIFKLAWPVLLFISAFVLLIAGLLI